MILEGFLEEVTFKLEDKRSQLSHEPCQELARHRQFKGKGWGERDLGISRSCRNVCVAGVEEVRI